MSGGGEPCLWEENLTWGGVTLSGGGEPWF
jgi:hypothetical protein